MNECRRHYRPALFIKRDDEENDQGERIQWCVTLDLDVAERRLTTEGIEAIQNVASAFVQHGLIDHLLYEKKIGWFWTHSQEAAEAIAEKVVRLVDDPTLTEYSYPEGIEIRRKMIQRRPAFDTFLTWFRANADRVVREGLVYTAALEKARQRSGPRLNSMYLQTSGFFITQEALDQFQTETGIELGLKAARYLAFNIWNEERESWPSAEDRTSNLDLCWIPEETDRDDYILYTPEQDALTEFESWWAKRRNDSDLGKYFEATEAGDYIYPKVVERFNKETRSDLSHRKLAELCDARWPDRRHMVPHPKKGRRVLFPRMME